MNLDLAVKSLRIKKGEASVVDLEAERKMEERGNLRSGEASGNDKNLSRILPKSVNSTCQQIKGILIHKQLLFASSVTQRRACSGGRSPAMAGK